MQHFTRITEQLNWNQLRENYFIGSRVVEALARDAKGKIILTNGEPKVIKSSVFVNELQEAVDDGRLDALVAEAATLYHGGNTKIVIDAIVRNLDSQRSNMKKREYAPNKKIDEIRLETLTKFVNARRTTKSHASGTLPQWAYGPAEIDAIEDPNKLQNVINSINDACCNKSHMTYSTHLGENYVEVAKANRAYAQKRKAELVAKVSTVGPEILAKLAKGSKVTLTQEEAAQLMKLRAK